MWVRNPALRAIFPILLTPTTNIVEIVTDKSVAIATVHSMSITNDHIPRKHMAPLAKCSGR